MDTLTFLLSCPCQSCIPCQYQNFLVIKLALTVELLSDNIVNLFSEASGKYVPETQLFLEEIVMLPHQFLLILWQTILSKKPGKGLRLDISSTIIGYPRHYAINDHSDFP